MYHSNTTCSTCCSSLFSWCTCTGGCWSWEWWLGNYGIVEKLERTSDQVLILNLLSSEALRQYQDYTMYWSWEEPLISPLGLKHSQISILAIMGTNNDRFLVSFVWVHTMMWTLQQVCENHWPSPCRELSHLDKVLICVVKDSSELRVIILRHTSLTVICNGHTGTQLESDGVCDMHDRFRRRLGAELEEFFTIRSDIHLPWDGP